MDSAALCSPIMVFRSYRYRLLPTRTQHRRLEQILDEQRQLYNAALAERIDCYRKTGKTLTRFDQQKSLTLVRADDPDGIGAVPINLSRHTLSRLDLAFQGFFRRVKAAGGKAGFPRFKGQGHWDSFGFLEWAGIRLMKDRLFFKGLVGGLRVHLDRPLPDGHRLRCAVLRRDAKGWLIAMQLSLPIDVSVHSGPAVGLDIGIHRFATLSDGTGIPSLQAARRAAGRLRRAQRALSRSKKGSNTRAKRRRRLAREHLRLTQTRHSFLHQASAAIARRYSLIAVEALQVQGMTASAKGTTENPGAHVRQKAGLNRQMLDVSPATFFFLLGYKAEKAGGRVVKINAAGTSQLCSHCGANVPKALSVRIHRCMQCGEVADRDLNAARNILARAGRGPGQPNVAHGGVRAAGNLNSTVVP